MLRALILFFALTVPPASAQDQYGQKGIYPVYEANGQWTIFDKRTQKKGDRSLALGSRFLLIGSSGAQAFQLAKTATVSGAVCRKGHPVKVRAALLKGPRKAVTRPLIAIAVPQSFTLKGSRAAYKALTNEVTESTYARLLEALKNSAIEEAKSGQFHFRQDDAGAAGFIQQPKPEHVQVKIDFGTSISVKGLAEPFVFVEETQISGSDRRCFRLADGAKLIGGCAEMPRALMAETHLLDFVSYDPGGSGSPFVLAFTRSTPKWGDERWGFTVRAAGPKLFMMDAMDIRCRDSF